MSLPIIIGIVVMVGAAALFAMSLCKVSARADRWARQDYLLTPYQGERPCTVCGKPTPATLNNRKRTPIHPGCRSDVA